MNREKGMTNSYSHIPEAEMFDYWEEDSECIIYNKRLVKEDIKKDLEIFKKSFFKN